MSYNVGHGGKTSQQKTEKFSGQGGRLGKPPLFGEGFNRRVFARLLIRVRVGVYHPRVRGVRFYRLCHVVLQKSRAGTREEGPRPYGAAEGVRFCCPNLVQQFTAGNRGHDLASRASFFSRPTDGIDPHEATPSHPELHRYGYLFPKHLSHHHQDDESQP